MYQVNSCKGIVSSASIILFIFTNSLNNILPHKTYVLAYIFNKSKIKTDIYIFLKRLINLLW